MGWVKPKLRKEVSKEHRAQAVVSGGDGARGSLASNSVLAFHWQQACEGGLHGQAKQ